MTDLSTLPADELEKLNQKLMAERDAIRDRQFAIKAELRRRHAAEEVDRLLAGRDQKSVRVLVEALQARAESGKID